MYLSARARNDEKKIIGGFLLTDVFLNYLLYNTNKESFTMNTSLELTVYEIESSNLRIKSIFEILSELLYEFDCSKNDRESFLKFTRQVYTLIYFGEQQVSDIDEKINLLLTSQNTIK